jgi:hypothetical protein
MTDSTNYGIIAQNINAENIAVGANARIEQTNRSERLAPALADLARAIAGFQGPPAEREALLAAHAEIAQELDAPAPDKGRLLARLARLRELAGPAATIVQAAAALAQAIAAVH